jgi:hypothetical protein
MAKSCLASTLSFSSLNIDVLAQGAEAPARPLPRIQRNATAIGARTADTSG